MISVSLCILIKNLCKALDQSRGSSAEYRNIIAQLWALDDVLVQAESLADGHGDSDELQAQYVAICRSVDLCRQGIDDFYEKVKKFKLGLRRNGSKNAAWVTLRENSMALFLV